MDDMNGWRLVVGAQVRLHNRDGRGRIKGSNGHAIITKLVEPDRVHYRVLEKLLEGVKLAEQVELVKPNDRKLRDEVNTHGQKPSKRGHLKHSN